MNTFLIVFNLAAQSQAASLVEYYKTSPDMVGWKGKICVESTCEEIDRTHDLRVLGSAELPAQNEAPEGGQYYPVDPVEKIIKGLSGLAGGSAHGDLEVTYKSTKTEKDGTKEETSITVKVGAEVKK